MELNQIGPRKWAIIQDGQEIASGTKAAMEAALKTLREPKKKIFLLDSAVNDDFMQRADSFGSQQKAFESAVECILALDPSQVPALKSMIEQSGVPLRKHMEAAWTFILAGPVVQSAR